MPLSRKALRRSYQGAVLLSVLAIAPLTWAWLASIGHRAVADSSPGWMSEIPEAPVALCRTAGLAAFGVGDDSAKQWVSTYSYAAGGAPWKAAAGKCARASAMHVSRACCSSSNVRSPIIWRLARSWSRPSSVAASW